MYFVCIFVFYFRHIFVEDYISPTPF